jgi:hypothetical protein
VKVELCDWCGDIKHDKQGATIKVYQHHDTGDYDGIDWGTTYVICESCRLSLQNLIKDVE